MKTVTAKLKFAALLCVMALGAALRGETRYGLFVGINEYTQRANYLNGCDWDAMRMLDAYTTGGTASQTNCELVASTAATKDVLRQRFREMAAKAVSGDTVLYYHSGHGGDYDSDDADDDGACLCATDADWYDYEFAEDLEAFKPGVNVVIVIDACYSGGMFKSAGKAGGGFPFAASVRRIMAKRQRQKKGDSGTASIGWITAADSDETSSMEGRGSEFTHRFLEGWQDALADEDDNGLVSFGELGAWAAESVEQSSVQLSGRSVLNAVNAGHAFDVDECRALSFDGRFYGFFGECPKSIVIPDGIVEIADSAFDSDYADTGTVWMLESVSLPASLRKIGIYAFYGCDSLETVTFRGDRTLVGFADYAFDATPAYDTLFPAPENDDFANAAALYGESGTVRGTTFSATMEDGAHEDLLSDMWYYAYYDEYDVESSVWYSWTATRDGFVAFSASSTNGISRTFAIGATTGYDEDFGLWEISAIGQNGVIGFFVSEGVTYHISVGSWEASVASGRTPGDFSLAWSMPDSPANDDFADAAVLYGESGSFSGSTIAATAEDDDFLCGYYGTVINVTVWYKWTAPRSGIVKIKSVLDETEFLVGVTTGRVTYVEDDDEWEEWSIVDIGRVYSNDYNEEENSLAFKCVEGTTYYISIGQSPWNRCFDFSLSWQVLEPAANDDFADAIALSGAAGTVTGTTENSVDEFCDFITEYLDGYCTSTVWYRWTAPFDGMARFNVTRADGSHSMWYFQIGATTGYEDFHEDGYNWREWDALALSSSNAIEFECESNATYYISVANYPGQEKPFTLSWAAAPPTTLSLDPCGGVLDSTSVPAYGIYGSLPTPQPPYGMVFAGWWTTSDESGVRVSADDEITATSLYAHWRELPAVTAYIDGESPVTLYAETVAGVAIPTSGERYFMGWWTDATGGDWVSPDTPVSPGLVIYAHWQEKTLWYYTQPYYDNNGVQIGVSITRDGWSAAAQDADGNLPFGVVSVPYAIDGQPVVAIGYSAFLYCRDVTEVVLPQTVREIGGYAFYCCESLAEISLPSSLRQIQTCAFEGCYDLTAVEIPASVSYIDGTAFRSCRSLDGFSVSEDNEYYTAIDGVLYTKDGTTLVSWPARRGGEALIADGTKTVGSYAFCYASITSVSIPVGVNRIEYGAFYMCENLATVDIPSSVTYIGYDAFRYSGLVAGGVTIGNPDAHIESTAFGNTAYEASLPLSMTVSNGVVTGFTGGCPETIDIGEEANGASVTQIGNIAFDGYNHDMTPLRRVGVPEGVVNINNYAFRYCRNLETVELPSTLQSIGSYAFSECYSLTNLVIPASVTTIESYAFGYCNQLREIVIPASVTSLGNSAFYDCSGLRVAYVPSALWSQVENYGVFNGCNVEIRYYNGDAPEFATVTLDWNDGSGHTEELEFFQVFEDLPVPRKEGYSVEGWYFEPQCVNRVEDGDAAVDGATIYANWVETAYEFTNYSENDDGTVSLIYTSVYDSETDYWRDVPCVSPAPYGRFEVPDEIGGMTVSRIDYFAFLDCDEMTEIFIPAGVYSIDAEAFAGCTSLTNIVVDENNAMYCSRDGFLYDKSGETLILCPPGIGGDVIVPDGTKYIRQYAFMYNHLITYVELPEGVESIRGQAFYHCSAMESVYFPATLRTIGGNAFCYCTSLQGLDFQDGLEEIGYYAFNECHSLEYVYLPEGLRSIGSYAFAYCDSENFTSVSFPSSIEFIGDHAFYRCTSLAAVSFGEETQIAESAFDRTPWGESNIEFSLAIDSSGYLYGYHGGCPAELEIPSSVRRIGNSAFNGCTTLESLFVPGSVTYIDYGSFGDCPNLTQVSLPSTLRSNGYTESWMRGNVFYGCPGVVISYYDVVERTVTFDANGGEYYGSAQVTVVDGMPLENISQPALDGCVFAGWWTTADTTGVRVDSSTPVTNDLALVAHWVESPFSSGATDWIYDETTGAYKSGCYSWDSSYAYLTVSGPCRVSFDWNVVKNGGYGYAEVYIDGISRASTSSDRSGESLSFTFADFGAHTLQLYFYNNDLYGSADVQGLFVSGLAVEPLESFTATLDARGGTLSGDSADVFSGAVELPIPTRDGYDFMGWWTQPTGGEWISPDRQVTADFTAYAHWQQSVYTWATQPYYDEYGNQIGVSITTDDWYAAVLDANGNQPAGVVSVPYAIDGQPVVAIGYSAFLYCRDVTEIILPQTVREIGGDAFYYCESLAEISLPSSLRQIQSCAFESCYDLTAVEIPVSVSYISGTAFSSCRSLDGFSVSEDNEYYTAIDGVLYTKDGTTLVSWPAGRGGAALIAEGTRTIGSYAFSNCGITSVSIPDGVERIENNAFYGGANLATVDIPSSVTYIGGEAFAYSGLVAGGVTTGNPDANIEPTAFRSTAYEASLPFSMMASDGVVTGFTGGCPETIDIDAEANGENVTEIGSYAFYGYDHDMTPLKRVVIPEGVVNISYDAFHNCTNLEIVELPSSLQIIESDAFYECYALTNLIIPASVESIGSYAFAYCRQLREIVIPASVTRLGSGAFYDCSGLRVAYVPSALRSQVENYGVFNGCYNLAEIRYYDGEAPEFATVMLDWNDGSGHTEDMKFFQVFEDLPVPRKEGYIVDGWYLEPECVNRVEDGDAAQDGTTLYALWVETEYEYNYYDNGDGTVTLDCSYEYDEYGYGHTTACVSPKPYGRFVVPSEIDGMPVTRIDQSAFYECDEMTEIVIPASVVSIYFSSFGSLMLTNVVVDEANQFYRSIDGMLYDKSGETLILCPSGKGGDISVHPGTKIIGEQAFSGNDNITSVMLPDGLEVISYGAFGYCNNEDFTSISIPSSVRTIEIYAFRHCWNLADVDFGENPNLVESRSAFASTPFEASRQFSIVVRNGTVSHFNGTPPANLQIGEYIDGEEVTRIGYGAFCGWYDSSLQSAICTVSVPEGITVLEEGAFASCYNMSEILLPESLKEIGQSAFSGCSSLQEIYLPENVESVAYNAFDDCPGLQKIYAPETLMGKITTSYGTIEYYPVNLSSVTLDWNDGTGHVEEINVHGVFSGLPAPRAQDWTFLGWFTEAEGGQRVVDGDIAVDGSFLYAHWTPTVYEFTHYYENGDGTVSLTYDYYYDSDAGYWRDVPCVSPAPYGRFEIPDEIDGKPVSIVDYFAFINCNEMTEIYIPAGVTRIDLDAFAGCSSLARIDVDEDNEKYSSVDGLLYDKTGEELILCPVAKSGVVEIPDGTHAVDAMAFYHCDSIEEIYIPGTVEYIDEEAFAYCDNLSDVHGLEDLPEDAYIAPNAFARTPYERRQPFSVVVDGDTIIGMRGVAPAMLDLGDYVEGLNVSEIADYAFSLWGGYFGENIQTLVVPEGIERIGVSAFADCAGIRSVTLPGSLRTIAARAFRDCDSLRKVRLPWDIESVHRSAFENCGNLTVEVPRRLENSLVLDYVTVAYYDNVIDGDVEYADEASLPAEKLGVVSGSSVTIAVTAEPTAEKIADLAGHFKVARGAEGQDAGNFKLTGKYDQAAGCVVLKAEIDEDAVKLSETVAEIMTPANLAALDAGDALVFESVVPGFYYGVAVAGSLDELTALSPSGVSLTKANEGTLSLGATKPSGGSAFFRVVISDKQQ